MTTIDQLIAQRSQAKATLLAQRNGYARDLEQLRQAGTADGARVAELRASKDAADVELDALESGIAALTTEKARDAEADSLARDIHPTRAAGSRLEAQEHGAGQSWRRMDTGEDAVASGRIIDHPAAARQQAARQGADDAVIGQHGSLGTMIRAMSTTGGSAIVPTAWAADIIDLARNHAAVLQAGAPIVPMDAKTVQIGRLTTDPTAAFRLENAAITASDPALDNVTLTAKTLSALVIGSVEWFQDAANAETIVQDAIARAMANTIDLAALYGGTTTGAGSINLPVPPNPRGVLAALQALASANVLGGAVNGTNQTAATFWSEVLDAVYTVKDANEQPNALIWASKLARIYAKATDTTGQPLGMPSDVADLLRLTSNQLPSYTQGTLTTATDLFVADWTQLLIGQRLDIQIQVLTERYADNGQIGIVATWRGDVQPARPKAFAVYRSLKGA